MAEKMSMFPPPPPPQWAVDMNSAAPSRAPKSASFPDPPGYSAPKPVSKQRTQPSSSTSSAPRKTETDALKLKKAWELALAPAKQLPMNAIMMYMSGNSLQIFSIMMVFMLFKGPITGIIGTNAAFAKLESESIRGQMVAVKVVYVAMQCVLLALGVWKVNGMGLLPTARSDWLAWETERSPLERVYFAFK
ncbi:hypothetical protein McanMca71_005793 [Microsporum canis]